MHPTGHRPHVRGLPCKFIADVLAQMTSASPLVYHDGDMLHYDHLCRYYAHTKQHFAVYKTAAPEDSVTVCYVCVCADTQSG